MNVKCTDGIKYIVENGYSWFITDMIVILKNDPKVLKESFCAVKLEVKDGVADAVITDGNNKILYSQHYKYTDAKIKDLLLYYIDGVLLYSGEY